MQHLTKMQKHSNELTITAMAIGKCISDLKTAEENHEHAPELYHRLPAMYEVLSDALELLLKETFNYLEAKKHESTDIF